MPFDPAFLADPMIIFFGLFSFAFIAVVLALLRNRTRLWIGLAGGVAGYIALGTKYALELAEKARTRGGCPDAAWGGPAKGALVGALASVVAYELLRRCRPGPRNVGRADGNAASG